MQHMLTPYFRKIEPFVWWEGAFSEKELDWLQAQAKAADIRAEVGALGNTEIATDIRRSKLSWLHKNPDTVWIFERLAHVASSLNSQYYSFDLTGFGEGLQLTNYVQSENGMYGWHQDYGAQVSRKLSLVLQLTDPAEYEGGNLQIMTNGEPQTIRKQRGLIAAFPSYVVHQVTPVTQGSRQSLVAWVSGPNFK